MTMLRREGGIWLRSEIDRFASDLRVEVSVHPQHPEYIILFGHHTKDDTLKALGGGLTYTVTQIVGRKNKCLPFDPAF